jgi:5-methylcytosine-specific restriction endonuclease McrA
MKGEGLNEELRRYLGKYLRRLFYRSPVRRAVFKNLPHKCIECQESFNKSDLEVEHVDPVVPTDRPVSSLEYFRRMFSLTADGELDTANLVLCCRPCHKRKSAAEMSERAKNKQGPYSPAARARRHVKKRKAKRKVRK